MGFPRNHFPSRENRPKLLKDFLMEDSNSCSSSGFRSFSRNPLDSNIRTLIEKELVNVTKQIAHPGKSNSKPRYFLAKIYSFQSVVNVVKRIHLATVKSPSILPRSLSRKLSKRSNSPVFSRHGSKKVEESEGFTAPAQVKVKDIIRWASSRDLVDIESAPLDSDTPTSGSSSTSAGSSWCESDFSATSDYLPRPWNGTEDESVVQESGKSYLPRVGEDPTDPTRIPGVGPKKNEEQEQQSPISVIDFNYFGTEEEDHSFANVQTQRTRDKLMEKLHRFERLAKMAPLENWTSMDEPTSSEEEEQDCREEAAHELDDDDDDDGAEKLLLLDFFREELSVASQKYGTTSEGLELGERLISRAKEWTLGEDTKWMGWEVVEKRKEYVEDMENGVASTWSKFEGEQQEIAFGIGDETLAGLVDDLLIDLLMS